MSRTWSEILVPVNGTYVVNDTVAHEGEFHAIKVTGDAVISELLDFNEVDTIDNYVSTPATAVKAGTLITPLNASKPFKGITLASGQVTLVL